MRVDRGAWYGGDDGKVICGSDAMLYAAGKRCSWGIDGADWQQERRAGGDGAAQGRVIVSADIGGEHGDSGKVSQLADRMWKSGADIIKIRARPSSVMDSLRMLQFVQGQPGTPLPKLALHSDTKSVIKAAADFGVQNLITARGTETQPRACSQALLM